MFVNITVTIGKDGILPRCKLASPCRVFAQTTAAGTENAHINKISRTRLVFSAC